MNYTKIISDSGETFIVLTKAGADDFSFSIDGEEVKIQSREVIDAPPMTEDGPARELELSEKATAEGIHGFAVSKPFFDPIVNGRKCFEYKGRRFCLSPGECLKVEDRWFCV